MIYSKFMVDLFYPVLSARKRHVMPVVITLLREAQSITENRFFIHFISAQRCSVLRLPCSSVPLARKIQCKTHAIFTQCKF